MIAHSQALFARVQQRVSLPRARYGLDPWLCTALALLLTYGLIMVASASVAQAEKLTGDPAFFFNRQLMFAGIGVCLGAVLFCVPLGAWQRMHIPLYLGALALLLLVLLPGVGVVINGSRRWLSLGFFRFQASEPARLMLMMFVAAYVARRQAELQTGLRGLLLPLVAVGLACALQVIEPDLGGTVMMVAVVSLMLFLGGARVSYYAAFMGVAALGFVYLAVAEPYRLARMVSFSDPWADVEGHGWQLAQSLIAIGRGQWSGVGLGNSVQKLLYLPEMHTDFIFAILAEELGLFGIALLLGLFGVIVWRGFAIAQCAERRGDLFAGFLAYGLTGWVGMQALVNMGVNLGLLPTKGLTLPMVSFGGSSLMTVCMMMALLLRVDYENRRAEAGDDPAGMVPEAAATKGARR